MIAYEILTSKQANMNILDKQIRTLLNEAMITIGAGSTEEKFLLPDELAQDLVTKNKELGISKESEILAGSSLIEVMNSFPASLRSKAIAIYFRYRNEIEKFRKENKEGTLPEPGSHPLSEPWQLELLMLSEGDRAGAIGKGEVLSCFLWNNATLASANQKSVDVSIGRKMYSVKYAETISGEYKLNGVYENFKSAMKKDVNLSKYTNLRALLDSKMTVAGIIDAIMKDVPADKNLQAKAMQEFLTAADVTVKTIGESVNYDFILYHSRGYRVVSRTDVEFQSADSSQAKVGIKVPASGTLRKLVNPEAWPDVSASSISTEGLVKQKLLTKFVKMSLS